MQVKIKSGRAWHELDVLATREQLEEMRSTWRQWLRDHQRPGIESDGTEAGACRSVVGIDSMPISGFDRLTLGLAVAAKTIRYV